MVVNDDRSEITKGTWYSRLARERLDLSVSVEETLVHPRREQLTWQEELNEQTNVLRTTHGRLLFPPRLSLQSRPFPVVDSTGFTQVSRTNTSGGLQSTASDLTLLMRFAQRLTSSFAALERNEACAFPASARDGLPFLASEVDTFQPAEEPPVSTSVPIWLANLGTTRPFPPVPSFVKRPQPVPGKQRLAGRAVRVRLETAPIPITAHTLKQVRAAPHMAEIERRMDTVRIGLGATSAHLPILSNTRDEVSCTSAHLPIPAILSNTRDEVSCTSAHLPIPDLPRTGSSSVGSTSAHLPVPELLETTRNQPKPRTFAGCGFFEDRQSDVIMANPAITAASVVLVTLTENPGPVVLQYVSLQPGVGFTLHLTAPAARKIAFNYVILVGELFQDAS